MKQVLLVGVTFIKKKYYFPKTFSAIKVWSKIFKVRRLKGSLKTLYLYIKERSYHFQVLIASKDP